MGLFDLTVLAFAVALLLLAARRWSRRAFTPAPPGFQEFTVHHDQGGFRPNVLLVRPGIPVRIRFQARSPTTVVIPHWGVRRRLSALRKVTVDLVPTGTGRYRFFGAEDAQEGRIVVVAGSKRAHARVPARR